MIEASEADWVITIVFGVIGLFLANRIRDLTSRCNAHRYNITLLKQKIESLEEKLNGSQR
jgi:hypothetical protein